MPKELLDVDKPLIQYAAEEAIAAGIDTLIFVTGRNKRAIEDHFDANNELETVSVPKVMRRPTWFVISYYRYWCIFVRQAEQLGLGHAVLCGACPGWRSIRRVVGGRFSNRLRTGVTADLTQAFASSGETAGDGG